jgi:hypothetical protein
MKKVEVLHQTLNSQAYERNIQSALEGYQVYESLSSFNQLLMVCCHFSSYLCFNQVYKKDSKIWQCYFLIYVSFSLSLFRVQVLFKMSVILTLQEGWMAGIFSWALKCKSRWIIHAGLKTSSLFYFYFCMKCTNNMLKWVWYTLLYMMNSEGMCSCVKLLWLTAFVLSASV